MMKKIINIVNVIADIMVTMAIIVLGIMLLTIYVVDNDFDDDNFYALIGAIATLKLFDRLENNVKKIGKGINKKEESK